MGERGREGGGEGHSRANLTPAASRGTRRGARRTCDLFEAKDPSQQAKLRALLRRGFDARDYPSIGADQVLEALRCCPVGKICGSDDLVAETLRRAAEEDPQELSALT